MFKLKTIRIVIKEKNKNNCYSLVKSGIHYVVRRGENNRNAAEALSRRHAMTILNKYRASIAAADGSRGDTSGDYHDDTSGDDDDGACLRGSAFEYIKVFNGRS